ncbi:MAG: threonine/serine dehydratase [Desulfobacteraceae bacterium]|nr:threonine/serine dehydratase [Desulfobacteraceae bacterium]
MISVSDVRAARERISTFVIETPLKKSRTLSTLLGTNLYLKMELFQKTGSFKPRGAFNQILQLTGPAREKGVVAFSGGNFAQGVAYAGSILDVEAVICMPAYTPSNYVEATKSYGGDVKFAPDAPSTIALAETYAANGYSYLHPFDNPNQMAGAGTIGLEILDDLPEVTDIFVSIGGGGLIAGIAVAVKAVKPEVRIWGVETEGADTMGQALQAGEVVQIEPTSLAKTLCAPFVAEDALRIAENYLTEHLTVTDLEAIESQQFLLERAKVLTELAASCTLSAAKKVSHRLHEADHVVLLLCGGNESLANMIAYPRMESNSS